MFCPVLIKWKINELLLILFTILSLDFLIHHNILLRRGHFYCIRPDIFCYKTQIGLNMGNVIVCH